jgi:isovaleryl-CoA dehydrogenase
MTATSQFSLTPDQQGLIDLADRFARQEMYPLASKMDDEEWWPSQIFSKFGEGGFLGVTLPSTYGGAGMSLLDAGLILQAFSRWNHALALSWVAHDNLCANNLFSNGSEFVRANYLPKMCTGEWIGCLALTEPGAGSDALGSMRTRAVRDGDHYVISGTKIYITNGAVADVCLLYAKTQAGRGSKGITAFVVECDRPGFKVAQKLRKMGFRGSQTAELVLENVSVPIENIVGEEHEGHQVVMSGLDLERSLEAAISVGIAERALDISIEFAKTRRQFGKPIASFQLIRARLADMYTRVEAMKCLCWKTLADAGAQDGRRVGRGKIHAQTAASIMYCADTCNQILDSAVQVHGGAGYIWESEVNRLFRSTKLLEIGAGTTEVRKLIIADELLD